MAHCGPLRLAIIHLLENIMRLTECSVEWADLESEVLPAMFTRIIQSFDLDFLHRLAATVEDGIPPRTFLHIVAALATPGDVTDVAHSASLLGYTHSGFVFSNLRTTIEDPTSWEHDTGFICPYAIDQPPTQAVVVFKREEMVWKMVMVAPVLEQVCQAHLYEMVAVMKHCRRAKFPIELEPICLDDKAIEPYLFLSRGVHQLCANKNGGEHDLDIKCEMVKLATSGLCRVKQTAVALTPASTTHTPEPYPSTSASHDQDSQGDTFPQSRKRKAAISNLGEDTLAYPDSESEYAPDQDEDEQYESDPQYHTSACSDEEDRGDGTDDGYEDGDKDGDEDGYDRQLPRSILVPTTRKKKGREAHGLVGSTLPVKSKCGGAFHAPHLRKVEYPDRPRQRGDMTGARAAKSTYPRQVAARKRSQQRTADMRTTQIGTARRCVRCHVREMGSMCNQEAPCSRCVDSAKSTRKDRIEKSSRPCMPLGKANTKYSNCDRCKTHVAGRSCCGGFPCSACRGEGEEEVAAACKPNNAPYRKDLDARLAEDDREKRTLVQSAWVPGARQLISHNILVKQLNGHFAGSGKDFTDGTEFSNVICDNLEIPRESAFKQIQALGLKDGTSIVMGRRKSDAVTESAYMFQERSVMGEAFDQLDLEFAYVLGVAAGLRLESIRVRVFRVACKSRWFPAPPNMRSDLDIGRALTAMGKGFDSPNAKNASKATEVMENLITPTGADVLGRYEAFLEWLGSWQHDFIMILWVAKGTVRAAPDMTAMGTDFYVVIRSQ
ncbi:hypothetical protein LTR15_010155 [Elasticomyces elasticus]|nr:hypothetical protein LTR15_010155 [Elasticomyces elasticus]